MVRRRALLGNTGVLVHGAPLGDAPQRARQGGAAPDRGAGGCPEAGAGAQPERGSQTPCVMSLARGGLSTRKAQERTPQERTPQVPPRQPAPPSAGRRGVVGQAGGGPRTNRA
jgi:hypothetical protein